MRAAKSLACCLLVLPLVGTRPGSLPRNAVISQAARLRREQIHALLRQANDILRAGHYHEAQQRFQAIRETAVAAGQPDLALFALGNLGGCQFALHDYRNALQSFLEAHRQADIVGDHSASAAIDANIASLYSELGDLDSAVEWLQNTISRLKGADRFQSPKIVIQIATLRARQNRLPEALRLFDQGIEAADRAGDTDLCANGWNRLGEEYLKRNELARAEPLLLEAYRLRKLNHLPLDVSYRSLGRLRLEQGDLISASALLDRAVEVSSLPQGWIPTWDIYHYRGRVRLAQGRLPEALADLRIAVRLARDWRWKAPTDDTSQIGAEGWLDQVHSALIEAGNRLYQQTHNPELIRETFEVAEENRSSSLRSVLSRRNVLDSSVLPSAYWEIIARLQLAEVHALRTQDTHSAESVSAIRAELVRMEVALGPELAPPPAALLDRTLAALDPSTAMLSFHLGDSVSWLWALDRHGLVLYELPKRTVIEAQAQAAASSIRENAILAPHQASAQLWNTLFTQLAPRFQNKSRWLVALDRGLFEVPLAALLDSSAIPPAYLVERHVIETIPSTGFWMEAQSRSATAMQTTFVGIGDPIYNTADPRLAESVRQRRQSANHALLLPRLVGSGNELDACSRVWRGDCVLLRGAAASRGNLLTQMQRNPAVIHIAAHFLESSQRPPYGLIALSLTPRGESQLVPPFEIAGWHTNAGLVVLSGCHSGEGAELPGTGLLGLTRAWLVAGAHSVIGSYWATPDESGALFGALYRNLSAARDGTSAVALRTAQLEMIRSGDWRSRPSFWAAYFIVGSQ